VIAFGPSICSDWSRATSKEWLETNGLGGYASSTVAGANTRRYHGLLVAALRAPTQRTLLLSKLEETLAVGDVEYDLSCNQYPGVIHPQGYQHLREFRFGPFPTFVYEVGEGRPTRFEKTVTMCRGRNLVIIRYRLLESHGTVGLIARPIVNCRDHHHLTHENPGFDTSAQVSGARDVVTIAPCHGVPPLTVHLPHAYFEPSGYWYHNFEYPQEAARGLDYREDQYSPGHFTCQLEQGDTNYLVASIEPLRDFDPAAAMEAERARRTALLTPWPAAPEEIRQLVVATDAFLVSRSPEEPDRADGIMAGYHWFEEWGRDAMISLPGLALVTGRFDAARKVLRSFADHRRDGLIANRIPDVDERPHYNTADATLWMFWAAQKYLDYTGDRGFVIGELLPILLEMLEWHVRGTDYSIGMDDDGLLRAGEAGTQLTWMDAKVGDRVMTPRHGKPVEINALWHNALRFVEDLGAHHAGPTADRVAARFQDRFWSEDLGYLYDVVDGSVPADGSLRPNQLLALSLPYPALEGNRARAVIAAVKRDLLTPYGLRTLSPRDARYRGRCQGDQWARDSAYHQGTVWPWLLGPFITAHMRVAESRDAARLEAVPWLHGLWPHLCDAGLGQLSEIFDGDPPHHPRGCIAQAWSVAEVLRAAVEDLELARASK